MATDLMGNLEGIGSNGLGILSGGAGAAQLTDWVRDGDAHHGRLSQTTAEMSETIMLQGKRIEDSSRKTERSAMVLVSVATVFCAFFAAVLCYTMALGIARPLEKLADQARRIAEGDLSVRAEQRTGSTEGDLLAASFNRMLEHISREQSGLVEQHPAGTDRPGSRRGVEAKGHGAEGERADGERGPRRRDGGARPQQP